MPTLHTFCTNHWVMTFLLSPKHVTCLAYIILQIFNIPSSLVSIVSSSREIDAHTRKKSISISLLTHSTENKYKSQFDIKYVQLYGDVETYL